MKHVRFLLVTVVQTLLRMLPWPCKTGLVTIGSPGRDAPVLLTGNFGLTVERVRRALEGVDAYLLVANSRGINVWCAAAGGHLTHRDIVSVLKTSGIEDLVDHRQLIMPQLAASGVEGRLIQKMSGWKVVWGPVYATSIPQFLHQGLQKTPEMRTVHFRGPQRFEMAVAWAFPISLLSLLVLPFWREAVLPLVSLVWVWSIFIFMSFPLYHKRLRTAQANIGLVFFDFGRRAILFFLWALFVSAVVGYAIATGDFSWGLVLRWALSSLIILLILSLDLRGSTPLFKSGLHEDRLLRIKLDAERCKGAGFCEQVCPTHVFDIDPGRHLALPSRAGGCVQCGACIVQCPFDALYFRAPNKDTISAETLRNTKLDLMGKRKPAGRPVETA